MSRNNFEPEQTSSHDFWTVHQAAVSLTNYACSVGARHIRDAAVRMQFNREVAYYARGIVRDVEDGRKSAEQAQQELKREQRGYLELSLAVIRNGMGVASGAFQLKTGVEVCIASAGTLCVVAGLPMIAHGSNNVYENGRNLWEGRSDTQGPLRQLYQDAAVALGKNKAAGDVAYGAVDLATSGFSAFRLVPKAGSWRLYRYMRSDFIRAYKKASRTGFLFDRGSDFLTVDDIRERWTSGE